MAGLVGCLAWMLAGILILAAGGAILALARAILHAEE